MPIPGGPRPSHLPARRLPEVAEQVQGAIHAPGDTSEVMVSGVSLSSRTVHPGDLYAALPGQRAHGADYAQDALAAGAVAVLTDPAGAERAAGTGLPVILVEEPRAGSARSPPGSTAARPSACSPWG